MVSMCRLNLLSISKFSDFCCISKVNLILYQIFIVTEPKIKIQIFIVTELKIKIQER